MTVSAPYYGENTVMRTPPPDLPSLLLKERIVYLGLPLFSDDDAKRQLGMDVTELIIAQLLYLEFEDPEKPIYFYINCLLYTSPSPRDSNLSRMPSSA